MSIVMDRLFDINAVNWLNLDPAILNAWEQEAMDHDPACRCHKCAVLFARMSPETSGQFRDCAIRPEIIIALRDILEDCGKR